MSLRTGRVMIQAVITLQVGYVRVRRVMVAQVCWRLRHSHISTIVHYIVPMHLKKIEYKPVEFCYLSNILGT